MGVSIHWNGLLEWNTTDPDYYDSIKNGYHICLCTLHLVQSLVPRDKTQQLYNKKGHSSIPQCSNRYTLDE